jgi:hypothetical protein
MKGMPVNAGWVASVVGKDILSSKLSEAQKFETVVQLSQTAGGPWGLLSATPLFCGASSPTFLENPTVELSPLVI